MREGVWDPVEEGVRSLRDEDFKDIIGAEDE